MKYLIIIILLVGCSRSPYTKVKNISTPTYRQIKKAMKESERHQPKYERRNSKR